VAFGSLLPVYYWEADMSDPIPFKHITRNPSLFPLPNGDVFGVVPQILQADTSLASDPTYSMTIGMSDAAVVYSCLAAEQPTADKRVLVCGTTTPDGIAGGLRWVPYLEDDDPSSSSVHPLTEVYYPRMTYDAGKNMVSLYFLTSFNKDYYVYSNPSQYPYDPEEFFIIDDETSQEKRFDYNAYLNEIGRLCLCSCHGLLNKFYVDGGLCGESGGDSTAYVIMPVFSKPIPFPSSTKGSPYSIDGVTDVSPSIGRIPNV